VDTWAGASPLLLPVGTAASAVAASGCVEPYGPLWRVWYLHPTREERCFFEVKEHDVSVSRVLAGYEASRTNSGFNTRLFARKNLADGVVSVTRGARYLRDDRGLTWTELTPDEIARILVEEFGYSEEIVAKLPPDERA
jgi:hypothetical protein